MEFIPQDMEIKTEYFSKGDEAIETVTAKMEIAIDDMEMIPHDMEA